MTDGLDHGHNETIDYIKNELMKNEKDRENGCKIFSIFFKNKEKRYDFGKWEGKAEMILQEIAKLGETENYYNSNSLNELYKIFGKINEAIQINYKLKLGK